MRISKEPEVRKQEMIDTAMRIFAEKGYEATSMTDIAKAMKVVPGLCYRYFKSKHELYETALLTYAKECSAPIIKILRRDGMVIDEYLKLLENNFIMTDGKERYHDFFHQPENEMFHRELELHMLKELIPYMMQLLSNLKACGQIKVDDIESTTKFIMYGQMPIINDDQLSPEEKVKKISTIIRKILN